jgi:hypothetical protein
VNNLFCAILRDLEHSDRFVRSQRYVLRRRSGGMQRSGFEIGFRVVTTDPELRHLDVPLSASGELPGAQAAPCIVRARQVRVALFQDADIDIGAMG